MQIWVYIVIGVLLYQGIVYLFFKNKDIGIKHKWLIGLTIFTLLFGASILISNYGAEKIGSIFEKSRYKTKYYVNLFPDMNSSKNYRVKAEIEADFVEWEESDNQGNPISKSHRVYYINKAYFPSGGYIIFDKERIPNDKGVEVRKKTLLVDTSGRYWWAELTSEKAK